MSRLNPSPVYLYDFKELPCTLGPTIRRIIMAPGTDHEAVIVAVKMTGNYGSHSWEIFVELPYGAKQFTGSYIPTNEALNVGLRHAARRVKEWIKNGWWKTWQEKEWLKQATWRE